MTLQPIERTSEPEYPERARVPSRSWKKIAAAVAAAAALWLPACGSEESCETRTGGTPQPVQPEELPGVMPVLQVPSPDAGQAQTPDVTPPTPTSGEAPKPPDLQPPQPVRLGGARAPVRPPTPPPPEPEPARMPGQAIAPAPGPTPQ